MENPGISAQLEQKQDAVFGGMCLWMLWFSRPCVMLASLKSVLSCLHWLVKTGSNVAELYWEQRFNSQSASDLSCGLAKEAEICSRFFVNLDIIS